ncbi:carboxypeptidase-like regulatory domain-containing protein [Sandarakinorhabdus oryzae]|uniref:DUF6795 domain-containing protein n=1 Tax=Sandarakinorhabdus oryzae TaxID=2675220 RepID=UPI0012E0EEB0|nr:carboxypeptidase-like regulatory domain-containing protein [Sandarakinorhabdus oryzae]
MNRSNRPNGARLALALLAAATLSGCNDMADMVIFSELHGQVLSGGAPVAGASVERSWDWGLTDEKGKDSTTTDAQGNFRLPAVSRRGGLRAWLPHEPFVEQTIRVTHAGQTVDVWMLDKRNYRAGGELGAGKQASALAVTVILDAPIAHNGPVYGRATISPLGETGKAQP